MKTYPTLNGPMSKLASMRGHLLGIAPKHLEKTLGMKPGALGRMMARQRKQLEELERDHGKPDTPEEAHRKRMTQLRRAQISQARDLAEARLTDQRRERVNDPRLVDAAIHEGAHGCFGIAHGLDIGHLELGYDDGESSGRTWFGASKMASTPAVQMIGFFLSGCFAESYWEHGDFRLSEGAKLDLESIDERLRAFGHPHGYDRYMAQPYQEGRAVAERFVARNHPWIGRVANQLLEQGGLTADDVRRLR